MADNNDISNIDTSTTNDKDAMIASCRSRIAELCLLSIYNLHICNKSTNAEYAELIDGVIGDMLMGKYRDGQFRPIKEKGVVALINTFYRLADEFYQKYHFNICPDLTHYVVYRGVSENNAGVTRGSVITCYIPFSTCIDKSNAEEWTREGTGSLLTIKVPVDTKFLCMDNADEGKEVVLPSGLLVVNEILVHQGSTTLISATFVAQNMIWQG